MNEIRTELNIFDNRLEKSIESLESLNIENSELEKEIALLTLEASQISDRIKEIIEQFNLYK